MARPIKETPVLYGKDARRMLREVENPKPLPKEFIERIEQARITLKKIQKNSYEEAGIKGKKWI
ncbi:MAG: hypothetical protein LBF08_05440 [Dysgonamonadaceae bacterium]|jgi:hypothetical protein|nr:hypothetical protein [Dysgonamonadaceae bacterium]